MKKIIVLSCTIFLFFSSFTICEGQDWVDILSVILGSLGRGPYTTDVARALEWKRQQENIRQQEMLNQKIMEYQEQMRKQAQEAKFQILELTEVIKKQGSIEKLQEMRDLLVGEINLRRGDPDVLANLLTLIDNRMAELKQKKEERIKDNQTIINDWKKRIDQMGNKEKIEEFIRLAELIKQYENSETYIQASQKGRDDTREFIIGLQQYILNQIK